MDSPEGLVDIYNAQDCSRWNITLYVGFTGNISE